jgi:hypothetical protein
MITAITTTTTTAIVMFLFLSGPSNVSMALSLSDVLPWFLAFKPTNKTGHSQIQKGPLTLHSLGPQNSSDAWPKPSARWRSVCEREPLSPPRLSSVPCATGCPQRPR